MPSSRPRKIYGSWHDGYVLDFHTTGSTYIGDNEFGHPQFETQRTEIGELIFRLKYRSDEAAVKPLADAAAAFIRNWGVQPTVIVPVPATRRYRVLQPVPRLADERGSRLSTPVGHQAIRRLRQFAELKNVYDAEERRRILEGAFEVKPSIVQAQRILLLDDLYRSGSTMRAIAEALIEARAARVYAFAFTQTRSHV